MEFAIVGPLVVVIAFGLLEFGLLFNHAADLSQAARSAARAGVSTMGADPPDDYYVLRALQNDNSLLNAKTIQRVVIYNADNGAITPSCKQGIATSGQCNVYTGAQMQSAALGSLNESAWPPSSRKAGTDYLGVEVIANNTFVTPLFSTTRVVSSAVAMQIQPSYSVDPSIPGLGMPSPTTTPIPKSPPPVPLAKKSPPDAAPGVVDTPRPVPTIPVRSQQTTTTVKHPAPKPPPPTTQPPKPKPTTTTVVIKNPPTPPTTAPPGGKNMTNPGM